MDEQKNYPYKFGNTTRNPMRCAGLGATGTDIDAARAEVFLEPLEFYRNSRTCYCPSSRRALNKPRYN